MLLHWQAWSTELRSFPDKDFANFVIEGIRCGFWIGFNHRNHKCISAPRNMVSAKQNPQPIQEYLTKELNAGRIIGPLPVLSDMPGARVQISCLGVIPKPSLASGGS